ncbi:hypothetical protein [Moraxella lacunata]|uniref:hypothetical protein n=1 Tax=Moraxella lacunata TaxID=477 RepID=UPI003EDF416A
MPYHHQSTKQPTMQIVFFIILCKSLFGSILTHDDKRQGNAHTARNIIIALVYGHGFTPPPTISRPIWQTEQCRR